MDTQDTSSGRIVEDPFTAGRRYAVIYADPPWHYRDQAAAGRRGVGFKYPLLDDGAIRDLPVASIAADDALLFLWVTWPKLPEVLPVIDAWGFRYKTVAFVWVKKSLQGKLAWGMGSWSRANTEPCLLGVRGRPRRASAGVHQVVEAPLGRHSEKPAEVRERIVALAGEVARIELFARRPVAGWDCWGNEAEGDSAAAPEEAREAEAAAWAVARARAAGAVRPGEIRERFGLAASRVTALLRDLTRRGLLAREGQRKGTLYRPLVPGEAPAPTPRPPAERAAATSGELLADPRARWALERAERLGGVRAVELRERFDLDGASARRLLKRLVTAGRLRQRGRARGTWYQAATPGEAGASEA